MTQFAYRGSGSWFWPWWRFESAVASKLGRRGPRSRFRLVESGVPPTAEYGALIGLNSPERPAGIQSRNYVTKPTSVAGVPTTVSRSNFGSCHRRVVLALQRE